MNFIIIDKRIENAIKRALIQIEKVVFSGSEPGFTSDRPCIVSTVAARRANVMSESFSAIQF